MTTKPHVHAELIKAWADGAEVEIFSFANNNWNLSVNPLWNPAHVYRIKPTLITKSLSVLKDLSGELYIAAKLYRPWEMPVSVTTPYVLEFDILGDIPSNPRFVKA